MSLQIWLPLNGDLHNQGLSNLTATDNGATVNNSGKIGKCYSFNGSSQKISINNISPAITSVVGSLACWVKFNSLPSSSGWFCLMQLGALGGFAACRLGVYFEKATGINISINGSTTGANYQAYTFSTGVWYHICTTYDGSKVKLYINGQEKMNKNATLGSYTTAASNLFIGGTNNYWVNGYMNDVRFYNHALSAAEVAEIAKGLVLHYKLDYGGIGNLNMLTNTHFDNRYSQTSGWDTTKNGTLLANQWGGYNSGVGNASTVYHAHLKELNGEYVYEFIRDANNSWLGISQGGLQNKLTAGKTYTFSWEQFCVSGSNYNTGGLYYYKTGATSAGFHLGSYNGSSGRKIGEWQKFSYTFTAPSDGDYSKSMAWYIYGHVGGNGTIYTRRPKLEEGAVATPWAPARSDPIYNLFADNFTTIYDCSGYGNDGTIVGNLTAAAGSPRYEIATAFNGSSAIKVNDNNWASQGMKEMTINLWVKPTAAFTKFFSCTEGGGWNTESGNSGYLRFSIHVYTNAEQTATAYKYDSKELQISAIPQNAWTMLTFIYDGSGTKTYINGELHHIYSNVSYGIHYNMNARLFLGCEASAANPTSPYFTGQQNDFRIYATALTAEQIKELYNTSATIDAFGNIYARELKEV